MNESIINKIVFRILFSTLFGVCLTMLFFSHRVLAAEEQIAYPEMFEKAGGSYGYSLLSDGLKEDYDNLLAQMRAVVTERKDIKDVKSERGVFYTEEVLMSHVTSEAELQQVWITFEHDHPEFYWLTGGCTMSSVDGEAPFSLKPRVNAGYTRHEEREAMDQIVLAEANVYVEAVKDVTDSYEKVRILHDKMIGTIEYAKSSSDASEDLDGTHSIVGVFDPDKHQAVCEGYSKAFAFLLNVIGIPQVYVTGKTGTEGHAWNAVSFDAGKTYYDVDVTWDDLGAESPVPVRYNYFAVKNSVFLHSHMPFNTENSSEEWQYELPNFGEEDAVTFYRHYGMDLYRYSQIYWDTQTHVASLNFPGDYLYILIQQDKCEEYIKAIGYAASCIVLSADEYSVEAGEELSVLYLEKKQIGVAAAAQNNSNVESAGTETEKIENILVEGATEQTTVESKAVLTVGMKYTDSNSGAVYKVAANKTMIYTGTKKKTVVSVVIPATIKVDGIVYKITAIQKNAFKSMKKLKNVVIGKNINTIGQTAFYSCKKLKKVTIQTKKLNKSSIGKRAFSKTPKTCVFKCPSSKKKKYKNYLKKAGATGKISA